MVGNCSYTEVWSHAKFKLCNESFLEKICEHAAKLPLAEGAANQKLAIIARFRNYTRFRNYDSGTTIPKLFRAIQKLLRAIQKLRLGNYYVRFRNYDSETMSCDSETTIRKLFRAIQKLLLRAIQKLRLGNYYVRFRNYD